MGTKRTVAIFLLLIANAFGGQRYYSTISINAGQVPSTQTNFPVLVSQTDNRFKSTGNGGHVASSSGFDIRPYTDTTLGTAITGYELERYNASTGEVIMWVKVASLSSSTTPIVLGYGDTTLTTDGSSSTTWDANFLGVYHLKDGTTLNLNSSTGSNNGTIVGSPTVSAAQIDGGITTLTDLNYVNCGTGMNPTSLTYSVWAKPTSLSNAYSTTIGRIQSGVETVLYVKSTGKLACYVSATALLDYDGTGSHTLSTNTFYHLALTYSSSTGLIGYVNGVSDGTASANGNLVTTATQTNIGHDAVTSGRYFTGVLDEVRISNTVRSANWLTTEYNSGNSPSTFETLGAEVSLFPSTAWFIFFQP